MDDEKLRGLVKEWRQAQIDIDQTPVDQRQYDRRPLQRLVDAHNALSRYADAVLLR